MLIYNKNNELLSEDMLVTDLSVISSENSNLYILENDEKFRIELSKSEEKLFKKCFEATTGASGNTIVYKNKMIF